LVWGAKKRMVPRGTRKRQKRTQEMKKQAAPKKRRRQARRRCGGKAGACKGKGAGIKKKKLEEELGDNWTSAWGPATETSKRGWRQGTTRKDPRSKTGSTN